ncbi:MAG: hypothetical protein M3537_07145 [Chloroflexota bacterium]|nr:hypothetical protein [Chloroflexota bacterium]
MTAVTVLAAPAREGSLLGQVAHKEIVRYPGHPLCLTGIALTVFTMLTPPEASQSSLGIVIAPAMGLGVFGLVVMASLTRSSDQIAESAGAVGVVALLVVWVVTIAQTRSGYFGHALGEERLVGEVRAGSPAHSSTTATDSNYPEDSGQPVYQWGCRHYSGH